MHWIWPCRFSLYCARRITRSRFSTCTTTVRCSSTGGSVSSSSLEDSVGFLTVSEFWSNCQFPNLDRKRALFNVHFYRKFCSSSSAVMYISLKMIKVALCKRWDEPFISIVIILTLFFHFIHFYTITSFYPSP